MHLINASKLKLEYFSSTVNLPPYVIISHRWETDEVMFVDVGSLHARTKKGYSKVVSCCKQALSDGYAYVWLDNCCIDKSSSAELSEAINSMYRWYRNASVCYAYLCDVGNARELGKSAWFTRSWTLQELLAPSKLVFFNQNWRPLGSKSDLRESIQKITSIPKGALDGQPLRKFSVAQRMSWASRRFATRVEDRAYSLMGLFDVNMPMLYGEGENAFIRLQEEIVKTCHDHSIFAWKAKWNHPTGLFASSPSLFKDSGHIVACEPSREPESYFMTNLGLSIKLSLVPWTMEVYIALLECCSVSCDRTNPPEMYAVFLRRTSRDWEYARVHSGLDSMMRVSGALLSSLRESRRSKRLYVPEHPEEFQNRLQYGFLLKDMVAISTPASEVGSMWNDLVDESHGIKKEFLIPDGTRGTAGTYILTCYDETESQVRVILKMGLDDEFCPLFMFSRLGDQFHDQEFSSPMASRLIGSTETDNVDNKWIDDYQNGPTGIELKDESQHMQWEAHQTCYLSMARRRGSIAHLTFLGISVSAEICWLRDEGSVATYGWVVTISRCFSAPDQMLIASPPSHEEPFSSRI